MACTDNDEQDTVSWLLQVVILQIRWGDSK